jgi:1,4-alpha-glucan branching enzyme
MALTLAVLVFSDRTPDEGKIASLIKEAEERTADVMFILDMPGASTVQVIGSFNRWRPEGFDMKRDEKRDLWVLPLQLDSGRYEYAFLVDDRIIVSDPVALVHQDDGFGNKNSILIVEGDNLHGTAI